MLTPLERREYLEFDVERLPWHHEPETYNFATRGHVSTAVYSATEALTQKQEEILLRSEKEDVDVDLEFHRLHDLHRFVRATCSMKASRGHSLEDKMEKLLVEYGYNKMKPPIRKRISREAPAPYVPYPNGRNVDCQRSAGTSPRKGLDEMLA